MTTTLNQSVARAHTEQLTRDANNRRLALGSSLEPRWSSLVIRLATSGDQPSLKRLAELDSRPAPAGTMLIAQLGGSPVAAVSLEDGELIANPFVPTSDVTELLRIRARQLSESQRPSRSPARQRLASLRPSLIH